jgi:hypothetical protein
VREHHWTVEALDGGFKIVDANKQAIAYAYGHANPRDAGIANSLTLDEARRIASNIAKLPVYSARTNSYDHHVDQKTECEQGEDY